MRIINRLKPPGEIRSVRLSPEIVVVRTDKEVFVYRRVEDGDVSMQDIQIRRSASPSKL